MLDSYLRLYFKTGDNVQKIKNGFVNELFNCDISMLEKLELRIKRVVFFRNLVVVVNRVEGIDTENDDNKKYSDISYLVEKMSSHILLRLRKLRDRRDGASKENTHYYTSDGKARPMFGYKDWNEWRRRFGYDER